MNNLNRGFSSTAFPDYRYKLVFAFCAFLVINGILPISPAAHQIGSGRGAQVDKAKIFDLLGRGGSLPNTDSVNLYQGSFNPALQMDVLAAKGGLRPDLRTVYSPSRANGLLGAGWSLAFWSTIERRAPSGGVADISAELDDPSDSSVFWLDGTKLVADPSGDGSFRPENDPFTVVRPAARSPVLIPLPPRILEWTVIRDGLTRTYGSTDAEGYCQDAVEYAADDCMEPVRWHLSRMEDSLGNALRIEYASTTWQGKDTRLLRPTEILYNDERHLVQFIYEARPDVRGSRLDGIQRITDERLAKILVKAVRDGEDYVSHQYRFEYVDAVGDTQSLLTRVWRDPVDHLTGSVGVGVTLNRYEYADTGVDDSPGWEPWTPLALTGEELTPSHYDFTDTVKDASYSTRTHVVDVNGDSLPDLIVLNTECKLTESQMPSLDGGEQSSQTLQCSPDHRVFLNRLVYGMMVTGAVERPDPEPVLEYDAERSTVLNEVIGPQVGEQADANVDYLITDLTGDGYVDLLVGQNGDVKLPQLFGFKHQLVRGRPVGWLSSDPVDLPWTEGLGGYDPFRELQLTDINGDGLLDLIGDEVFFLNSGVAPYFDGAAAQALHIYTRRGVELAIPANLPNPETDDGCMQRESSVRFVEHELGTATIQSRINYFGLDPDRRIDDRDWVWRHTSFSDYNGDGIADRLVALAWPEEAEVGSFPDTERVWRHIDGRCGGRNVLYLGDGRGGFHSAAYGVGGYSSWLGGPRAFLLGHTEVVQAPAVTVSYRTPVNHLSTVDLNGSARPQLIQICDGEPHALIDFGLLRTKEGAGYRFKQEQGQCPDGAELLGGLWGGKDGFRPLVTGYGDDGVLAGFIDLDGDGLPDRFVAHNPVHGSDPNRLGGDLPYWSRNLRDFPQHRLTAIIGPHGGRTEIEWSTSARQAAAGIGNPVVVVAIDGASGRTSFTFREPRFRSGRFVGFRQAEARGSDGIRVEWDFATERPLPGTLLNQATYSPGGVLHSLIAHVPGRTETGLLLDRSPPYFNPVVRTCTFEFGEAFSGTDPSQYVDKCEDFQDEPATTGPRYRMLVTETDYDDERGIPTAVRRLGDASTTDDNRTTTYRYHPYDEAQATSLLRSRRTLDVAENVREHYGYPLEQYAGTRWGTQIQWGNGKSRRRVRSFDQGVLVSKSVWGKTRVTTYTHDHCGKVAYLAVGDTWTETIRDEVCRPIEHHTDSGRLEKLSYDDFHRVTEHITNSGRGPDEEVRRAHDFESGEQEPTEVAIYPEPDGSETVLKQYTDAFGREWKSVRCRRDPAAPDSWTNNLDNAYACAPDDAAANDYASIRIKLYGARTGHVRFESESFDARDGTVLSSTTPTYDDLTPSVEFDAEIPGVFFGYDELARRDKETFADGSQVTHEFRLGAHIVTAAGITTRIVREPSSIREFRNGIKSRSTVKNAFGDVIIERDALSKATQHEYDDFGRLIKVILPEVDVYDSCSAAPLQRSPERVMTYSRNDQKLTESDPNGNITTFVYDDQGRVTEVLGPDDISVRTVQYFGGSADTRHVTTTDDLGNSRTVWLDGLDRPWKQVGIDGSTTVIDYDKRGRESLRTWPTGETLAIVYDRLGRAASRTRSYDQVAATETVRYDARGRVLHRTDADGEVREYTYDFGGRLLSEDIGDAEIGSPRQQVLNGYTEFGRLATQETNGVLTRMLYDQNGRLETIQTAFEAGSAPESLLEEKRSYTARDEIDTIENGSGEQRRTEYDALGRVRFRQVLHEDASLAQTEIGYDAAGNPVRQLDERGALTCIDYDFYNRPTAITPPGEGTTSIAYERNPAGPFLAGPITSLRQRTLSPTGEIVDVYLEGDGREWLRRLADGSYRQQVWDSGRIVRTMRRDVTGVVHSVKPTQYFPNSDRVAVEWDWMNPAEVEECLADPGSCASGRLEKTYTAAGRASTFTDSIGNMSRIEYLTDGSMLVERVEIGGVTEIRYEYDPQYPRVVASNAGPEADSIRTERHYTRGLRVEKLTSQRAQTGSHEERRFDYDLAGRRVRASLDRNGRLESEITWTYDPFGRLETKHYQVAGVDLRAPGQSFSLHWGYELTGQLSFVTYPSGNTVRYLYDDNGHLSDIELLTRAGSQSIAQFRQMDLSGRHEVVALSDDTVVQHHFDAGRESAREVLAGGQLVFEESYGYDTIGRLAAVSRAAATGRGQESTYQFDVRDLLTSERHVTSNGTLGVAYGYNNAGDRVHKTRTVDGATVLDETLEYLAGHRLDRIGDVRLGEASWDPFGRQRRDQQGRQFHFGLANQLIRIESPSGGSQRMLHDTDGQRVAAADGASGGMHFYVSGEASGQVLHHRLPDGRSNDIVRAPNGKIVAIIDPDGRIVPITAAKTDDLQIFGEPSPNALQKRFSAFGEAAGAAADPVEIGFHQTWSTAADNIRIAGVRAYDANTGRFLSPDPLGLVAGADANHGTDLYRYARNNPVALHDPTGYLGVPPPGQGTTIVLDGNVIEVQNYNSLSHATIEVANQAAYIAGVRAGLKEQYVRAGTGGMSNEEAEAFAEAYVFGDARERFALDIALGLLPYQGGRVSGGMTQTHVVALGGPGEPVVTETLHEGAARDASGSSGGDQDALADGFFVTPDGDEGGALSNTADAAPRRVQVWLRDPEGNPRFAQADKLSSLEQYVAKHPGWKLDIPWEQARPTPSLLEGLGEGAVRAGTSVGEEIKSTMIDLVGNIGSALQSVATGYGSGWRNTSAAGKRWDQHRSRGYGVAGAWLMLGTDTAYGASFGILGSAWSAGYNFRLGNYRSAGEDAAGAGIGLASLAISPALRTMVGSTTSLARSSLSATGRLARVVAGGSLGRMKAGATVGANYLRTTAAKYSEVVRLMRLVRDVNPQRFRSLGAQTNCVGCAMAADEVLAGRPLVQASPAAGQTMDQMGGIFRVGTTCRRPLAVKGSFGTWQPRTEREAT